MTSPKLDEERFSIAETAIQLNVSPSTVHRLRVSGALGFGKVGAKLYFTRKHIEDYLAANTFEPTKAKPRRRRAS